MVPPSSPAPEPASDASVNPPVIGPDDPVAFFGSIASGPWASPDAPANRVARALVRITNHSLDVRTSLADIDALVDRLEAIAAGLGDGHGDGPATRYRDEDRPDGHKVRPNATGRHPLAGPANATAPPIVLRREGDHAYGEVTYDLRFEGLPGLVQGGFIAAAFDLILGQAVALSGNGGMTGTLSVRYVSPTPLYQPLRYESWFDRGEGRKTFAKGELTVADTGRVCAQAEGIFISTAPRPAAG